MRTCKQEYPKLSIIIPAYNEEKTLGEVVNAVQTPRPPGLFEDAAAGYTPRATSFFQPDRVILTKGCGLPARPDTLAPAAGGPLHCRCLR